ncbi:pyridoxal phosphate-dependent aminotransferase [Candidatus Nitrosacidococcus sp. I8]|uniref:pyridoxal phosphate-dependent aminotransferase n=1 Tax=Candidatus Nitrosacidococcus sp. I8 TaxID=2942908 RepID=UPI0024CBE7C9|nr:pyridoxal phosphate-dependent aminotransferase [Candidatus Nitrosacidococcus sp. I8]CAH9018623.1 Aspartate/prephenate aminotransferase [Candidatus Nitrosacidococcus sp. I8]
MNIRLAKRTETIKTSPTLAITARAKAMKTKGKDIISLGAGEPDFDTPEHIKQAAIEAIEKGFTKYTAVDGIPSLKQAIVTKFARENNLHYQNDQILVSVGGKQCFYNLTQALLNPGDEVIIPAPYWVSYPDMVALAEATPVIIPATQAQQFKITPEQLESAITPRTRLFVINSPSNPTGVAYSKAEFKALGEVLARHPQVFIITDDIYEHIYWGQDSFCNIANACPDLHERILVLNGVSKAYSMTGWRIGYIAGPVPLIKTMKTIQSQSTSNPTSISQVAAQAALEGDQDCVKAMCQQFKKRHDFVLAKLNSMPHMQWTPSDGAFYAFPNVEEIIRSRKDIKDDIDLAEKILNEVEVALVPGSAFGAPNHLRLSFATSMEQLEQALDRIHRFLE